MDQNVINVLVDALTYIVPIAIFWALANKVINTLVTWISGGKAGV